MNWLTFFACAVAYVVVGFVHGTIANIIFFDNRHAAELGTGSYLLRRLLFPALFDQGDKGWDARNNRSSNAYTSAFRGDSQVDPFQIVIFYLFGWPLPATWSVLGLLADLVWAPFSFLANTSLRASGLSKSRAVAALSDVDDTDLEAISDRISDVFDSLELYIQQLARFLPDKVQSELYLEPNTLLDKCNSLQLEVRAMNQAALARQAKLVLIQEGLLKLLDFLEKVQKIQDQAMLLDEAKEVFPVPAQSISVVLPDWINSLEDWLAAVVTLLDTLDNFACDWKTVSLEGLEKPLWQLAQIIQVSQPDQG